jgi:osmoprotectant transport system permease protein
MIPAWLAQGALPRDISLVDFLFDAQRWTMSDGILDTLLDTIVLCSAVVVVATLIAVPLAAYLAHNRKGEISVAWLVTLSRAVPTLAVAALLVPFSLRAGLGFQPWPIFTGLLLLALPQIYINTYAAIRDTDRGVVAAARGMGFTESDVLWRVELALGSGVIMTSVRVAAVQVIATEPLRAFLGGDGLGRYVRDGIGQNNTNQIIGGAILIGLLAASTGLAFRVIERLVLPRGVLRLSHSMG